MIENIEAILLTGGASRRMGMDKAKILVEGEELAARIARLLSEAGVSVTICGRVRIGDYGFQRDSEEFAGPLAALAGFEPSRDFVFVASCDLIGFNAAIVEMLVDCLGGHDGAVPTLEGRLQPLCALYCARAIVAARTLSSSGERRVMRWIDGLDVVAVPDINSSWIANANTPEDIR